MSDTKNFFTDLFKLSRTIIPCMLRYLWKNFKQNKRWFLLIQIKWWRCRYRKVSWTRCFSFKCVINVTCEWVYILIINSLFVFLFYYQYLFYLDLGMFKYFALKADHNLISLFCLFLSLSTYLRIHFASLILKMYYWLSFPVNAVGICINIFFLDFKFFLKPFITNYFW